MPIVLSSGPTENKSSIARSTAELETVALMYALTRGGLVTAGIWSEISKKIVPSFVLH